MKKPNLHSVILCILMMLSFGFAACTSNNSTLEKEARSKSSQFTAMAIRAYQTNDFEKAKDYCNAALEQIESKTGGSHFLKTVDKEYANAKMILGNLFLTTGNDTSAYFNYKDALKYIGANDSENLFKVNCYLTQVTNSAGVGNTISNKYLKNATSYCRDEKDAVYLLLMKMQVAALMFEKTSFQNMIDSTISLANYLDESSKKTLLHQISFYELYADCIDPFEFKEQVVKELDSMIIAESQNKFRVARLIYTKGAYLLNFPEKINESRAELEKSLALSRRCKYYRISLYSLRMLNECYKKLKNEPAYRAAKSELLRLQAIDIPYVIYARELGNN